MSDLCNPNVLIIDNDEAVVRAIATRLEPLGYCCLTASSGAQGLTYFADRRIDLVITDLNMPMLDGAFVLMEIRRLSEVPVIVVTGFENEYAASLRGQTGVTVLRKPFDSAALIDLVEVELAGHRRMAG